MRNDVTRTLLLTGTLLAAMLVELTAGAVGWILPLVPAVFYFLTLNTAWPAAAFAALAVGAVLDLAFGRAFPITAPALLALTLASFAMRRGRSLSELPDTLGSIFCAIAACETVYALDADQTGIRGILQWLTLWLAGSCLALAATAAGRVLLVRLGLPDCFIPRSTLWKRRRLQNPPPRSDQA